MYGWKLGKISPPAWGWPDLDLLVTHAGNDFPTRVGMARRATGTGGVPWGFPHPRGDGPPKSASFTIGIGISPPAWGWPATFRRRDGHKPDFPTRVGMARHGYLPRRGGC